MLWWTLKQLQSKDSKARERAAAELAHARGPQVEAALVTAMSDPAVMVRITAARSLSTIGWQPRNLRERLIHSLLVDDFDSVIALGEPAVQPLIDLLKEPTVYGGDVAVILAKIGDARAVAPLAAKLRNQWEDLNRKVCVALVEILERSGSSELEPAVAEALLKQAEDYLDEKTQREAIRALGKANSLGAARCLVRLLLQDLERRRTSQVEELTIEMLKGMDPRAVRPALGPLVDGLTDKSSYEMTREYRVATGDDRFYEDRLSVDTVFPIRSGCARALREITGQEYSGDQAPGLYRAWSKGTDAR